MKILLIEDNIDHATLTIGAIKTAYGGKVTVIHVTRFSEALKAIPSVDIVISDLNLPDSEGFETVSSLISKMPHSVPLIVLTTKDDFELGEKIVTMGAQDYLVKGALPPQSLRRCIEFSIIRKLYEHKIMEEKEDAFYEANARSSFLANMSHEIRTPLNSIIGLSDLLFQEYEKLSKKEIKDSLETINRSSDLLLALINDILDLSKIESGEISIVPQDTNFKKFLSETCKIMQLSIEEKGNQLEFVMADSVPSCLRLDSKHIRQVLINIINNANKFTDNGTILVSAEVTKEHLLTVSVSDSGIGIPNEKLDTIFSPFKQVEGNASQEVIGSGLGLAICKKLIEAMHGTLLVESKVGVGSCFKFSVPFVPGDQINLEENTPSVSQGYSIINSSAQIIRILSVDDSNDNQRLIEFFLRRKNIELDYASNGKEAVETFKKRKYDLVLMDMKMPVLNGYEATYEVRKYERKQGLPETPIIALTASVVREELNMSLKAGCTDYLAKPIKKELLLSILDKTLQEKRSSATKEIHSKEFNSQIGILIVDDNETILEILKAEMKCLNWEIVTANSGRSAFDILKQKKIDVVVTDYAMPGMDGFELFRKSTEKNLIAPHSFLFTSGYPENIQTRLGTCSYKNRIFIKPYDISELKKEIGNILLKRK